MEQDLRMCLNILLNFLIYNNDDPTVAHEFTKGQFVNIEEICMRAVKISLELAIVPIRKFLIIFFIYIRLLFGKNVIAPVNETKPNKLKREESESVKKFKHLLYLKEYQDVFLSSDVTPRFNLKTNHAVELFYKRHMNNDQPIPQVIVVGIMRVLLTTCPNNQRNAGGIDLHAEWSSCLNFLIYHKEFFKEHNFKSKAFEKTDSLLDYEPKRRNEEGEE